MRVKHNLLGQRFGKLTVIKESPSHQGRSMWLCRCDCGNDKVIMNQGLNRGTSISCGSCVSFSANMEPGRYYEFAKYKSSANKRGLLFNISSELFKELTKKPCIYCGIAPTKSRKGNCKIPIHFTGIDRKDNTKGYEENNCFPCCRVCNFGKRKMSHEEYVTHLKQVALHMCKQNPQLSVEIQRFNYCSSPF